MTSSEGKVFAVTGGASGMGLATCRLLAKGGARAICIGDFVDANFAKVEEELSAITSKITIETTKIDVQDSTAVGAWMDGIIAKFGTLDGALNAAGVPQSSMTKASPCILGETDDLWRRIMGVNLDGLMYCCREEARVMSKLPKASRSIVNVASISPTHHHGRMYAYNTSKLGVSYISRNLAADLRPFDIRVNAVLPGATDTPMLDVFIPASIRQQRAGSGGIGIIQAPDVARVICWLLSSDDAAAVSGADIPIGPGMP